MKSAAEEFEQWYASRPDLEVYDEYPVYIVAAQGGGMYAADQTAIFLSRLQDNCPAFRNHLFAISAVSGGSVGAATFVSALRLAEQAPDAQKAATAGSAASPTPVRWSTSIIARSSSERRIIRRRRSRTEEKSAASR